jgi:hypothetical protein
MMNEIAAVPYSWQWFLQLRKGTRKMEEACKSFSERQLSCKDAF